MRLKRISACAVVLTFLLGLGLATSAQAANGKRWSLIGGGAQLHIGNGLALPIQPAVPALPGGTVFPPLLIPVKAGKVPVIHGTTALPNQNRFFVPNGALSKAAVQNTVGVKFSNPKVFAVGTNLKYVWPGSGASGVTFQQQPGGSTAMIAGFGGTMTYFNALGTRFGGAAQFDLSPGPPAGLYPASPVTVYAKINGTTPPCTHPAFAGAKPGCVAGILFAKPTGKGAIGGPASGTAMTPGAVVTPPNIVILKMGAVPLGTISAAVKAAVTPLPTNMASSHNGPWTTGQIVISQPAAVPPEIFTITGADLRAANGSGTIQMVAGSLSARVTSGPNANRGWVRLILGPPITSVPSMSVLGLATTVALMLLGFAYATRRRLLA